MASTSPTWPHERDRLLTDTRTRPTAFESTDLRTELGSRTASFRARLQTLRVEREAHYDDAIARIRTITADWERPTRTPLDAAPSCQGPSVAGVVDGGWERIWLSIVQVADGERQSTHPQD